MTYNSDSIRVLEGLEAVRLRPGMYIGSTGSKGLHHLVNEIIDNSIDEFLAGHCDEIELILEKDGSVTISDNGRGIPVDKHESGISAERIIMTTLHAGGKFDNDSYKVSGGLHGVGAAVVNALSERFTVTICKDGKRYEDVYIEGGNPQTKLKKGLLPNIGNTWKTGTTINFLPDEEIFETIEFKSEVIKKRLKELSFLNKGLTLKYKNDLTDEEFEYFSDEGIVGLIKEINKDKSLNLENTLFFTGEKDDVEVDVAIQYIKDFTETSVSYCNNINTVEGGNHVSGLRTAFTRVINQYARDEGVIKKKQENFEGRDIRSGMVSVISIRHPNPQYEGQTKTKLGNTDVRAVVDEILSTEMALYLDRNKEVLDKILDISKKSQNMRKTEEKVKNGLLSKSNALTINSKLVSCKKRKAEDIEIFIVEGDSAGGSAKQGRDREFQAILPLKGKPLNIERRNVVTALKNEEIATMISAFGCGFLEGYGDDFDISKLKYEKIILMTDADVDGAHIRTLLLTFLYRYMPDLIMNGHIYIAMPPLYKVKNKNNEKYLYNENEMKKYMKKAEGKVEVQRYKGLGEMNPKQLWDTTLNPKTRKLKQVEINDVIEASEITETLMSRSVPPRREFIRKNADMANIDI